MSQNLQALNCSKEAHWVRRRYRCVSEKTEPYKLQGYNLHKFIFSSIEKWDAKAVFNLNIAKTRQKYDHRINLHRHSTKGCDTLWIWNKGHCETLCESTSHFLFWLRICHTAPCVFEMISNSLNLCNFTLSWGAEPRLSEFWLFVQIENMTTRSVK